MTVPVGHECVHRWKVTRESVVGLALLGCSGGGEEHAPLVSRIVRGPSSRRFRSVPAELFLPQREDASSSEGRKHSVGKRLRRLCSSVTLRSTPTPWVGVNRPKDSRASFQCSAPFMAATDN